MDNDCLNLGEFDEALSVFKKALVTDSNYGEALYSIANIQLNS